jgi:hypothetical protein
MTWYRRGQRDGSPVPRGRQRPSGQMDIPEIFFSPERTSVLAGNAGQTGRGGAQSGEATGAVVADQVGLAVAVNVTG